MLHFTMWKKTDQKTDSHQTVSLLTENQSSVYQRIHYACNRQNIHGMEPLILTAQ